MAQKSGPPVGLIRREGGNALPACFKDLPVISFFLHHASAFWLILPEFPLKDLRKSRGHIRCDPGLLHHPDLLRMIREQEFRELHLDPLLADMDQVRRDLGNRPVCLILDHKIKLGGKPDSP